MTDPRSNGPDEPIDTQLLKVRQHEAQHPLTTWAYRLPTYRTPAGKAAF